MIAFSVEIEGRGSPFLWWFKSELLLNHLDVEKGGLEMFLQLRDRAVVAVASLRVVRASLILTCDVLHSEEYEMQEKTLVTGAAGFIGSHLTERLLERTSGYQIQW
jgi:hypothetical protein